MTRFLERWPLVFRRFGLVAPTLVLILALAAGAPSGAGEAKPTREDAVAVVNDAVALILSAGLETARDRFHGDPHFKHGEIYVNVIDFDGMWLVYPPRPSAEGKSVLDVRDSDGKLLVREIIKTAKEIGQGWVDYRWLNPANGKIEPKSSFVKRVADRNLIVYVGIYKTE